MHPSLNVSNEAESALALVAAGGDLHHGLGTAADYALREREESGISCHSIFTLSLHREGRRKLGGSFAFLTAGCLQTDPVGWRRALAAVYFCHTAEGPWFALCPLLRLQYAIYMQRELFSNLMGQSVHTSSSGEVAFSISSLDIDLTSLSCKRRLEMGLTRRSM